MSRPPARKDDGQVRPRPARVSIREAGRGAVAAAAPAGFTAAAALLAASARLPIEGGALPLRLLLVVACQAIGLAVARGSGGSERARGWWMALGCTCLLLPALALQASMARAPFVSLGSGSAGNLLLATGEVLLLLACMFVWTASVSTGDPSWAPLLWCPAALLVPAVLGSGRGDLTEADALVALAIASGAAAVAMAAGSVVARHSRLAVAAAVVVIELAALLAMRRGPSFGPQHGAIAPLMAMVLVLAAIGSVAAAQVAAAAARGVSAATGPARRSREGEAGPGSSPEGAGRVSSRSAPPSRR